MQIDGLRASRVYDWFRHGLHADPAVHEEFIKALGEGREVFHFASVNPAWGGMKFRFLNRDGIWAVGYDLDEFLANTKNYEIFKAVEDANRGLWGYLWAHMLSGLPGPLPEATA
jgi:hypothetical protein